MHSKIVFFFVVINPLIILFYKVLTPPLLILSLHSTSNHIRKAGENLLGLGLKEIAIFDHNETARLL